MADIIPAILSERFSDIEAKLDILAGLVGAVQIDVADGLFVPNKTWPYAGTTPEWEGLIKEQKGMPHWDALDFEFDLMIKEPEGILHQWIAAGASRLIVHLESTSRMDEIMEEWKHVVELGIAIGVATPLDALDSYAHEVAFVQCMGIEKIGFQKQSFDSRVIERVATLRSKYPNLIISVDGGVSVENAQALAEAGANRLVVGSALFGAPDFRLALHALRRAAAK